MTYYPVLMPVTEPDSLSLANHSVSRILFSSVYCRWVVALIVLCPSAHKQHSQLSEVSAESVQPSMGLVVNNTYVVLKNVKKCAVVSDQSL